MKVVKHGNSGLRAVVAWWLNQVDLGPRGFRVRLHQLPSYHELHTASRAD